MVLIYTYLLQDVEVSVWIENQETLAEQSDTDSFN